MKIPYGKHKGEDILDIPTDYLVWCSMNTVKSPVRDAIEAEIKRRLNPSTGTTTKLSRDVAATELHSLLVKIPDDMFGQDLLLGPFRVRFDKR